MLLSQQRVISFSMSEELKSLLFMNKFFWPENVSSITSVNPSKVILFKLDKSLLVFHG